MALERRALLLALLTATSVVALSVAVTGPTSAVATQRTSVSGTAPVTVYQGEELNVSALTATGGSTIGSGSATFVGLAGDADGTIETANANDVDFTNWATGTYDVDGDGKADVVVTTPKVTDVTLRLDNGADVTNRQSPADERITLTAEFNFDAADGVEIHVVGPDGLDVAPGVASSTRIDTSGNSVTLDFSDAQPGQYTVTVEGRNLEANRSVTVGIDTITTFLSLAPTSVEQGDTTRVTVHGDAGATYLVRIPAADLVGGEPTDAVAQQVFGSGGAVTSRGGSASQDAVYAVVKLDDSGSGDVVVRTANLRADHATTLQMGRGSDPSASTIYTATLQVRAVTTATPAPTSTPTPSPTPTTVTATPTATSTPTATGTPPPTSAGTATTTAPAPTTTASGGQPGFGLLVGLLGLIAAGLLALRR